MQQHIPHPTYATHPPVTMHCMVVMFKVYCDYTVRPSYGT